MPLHELSSPPIVPAVTTASKAWQKHEIKRTNTTPARVTREIVQQASTELHQMNRPLTASIVLVSVFLTGNVRLPKFSELLQRFHLDLRVL